MTAPTQSRSTSTGPLQPMLALARMEARIFFRNRTAVVNATLLPLGMAGFLALFGGGTGRAGVVVPIAMTISSCLLFVIYYSSVSSVVARRQSGVLKRLLTGTVDRPLILAALSLPLLALFAVEVLLGVVVATLAVGAVPVKPLLIPLAAVAGGLTWTLLGLASSLYTRTAESAQISTLPLMLGALLLSGLSIPVEWLPGPIRLLSELSPLRPVTDLIWLAATGAPNPADLFALSSLPASVGVELAILAGWSALSGHLLRDFRWEARV